MNGICLCGAVSYELDGPVNMMIHCHCSMCRKHHGTSFATFIAAPSSSYRLLSGADQIGEYASSPGFTRRFCRVCGSVAPTQSSDMADTVICPAGNLQGDLDARPTAHIFVGSKAPRYAITDSLPQHAEYPPQSGMRGVERPLIQADPGTVAGSCLCGDVAFQVHGAPIRSANCHCTRCRRGRSAAHATNYFYPLERFSFTRGEAAISDYRVPEARFFATAFCNRCGSAVPRISRERGMVVVPAGSLDSDPGVQPDGHIFVGSKANWFDITDALPQHETMFT